MDERGTRGWGGGGACERAVADAACNNGGSGLSRVIFLRPPQAGANAWPPPSPHPPLQVDAAWRAAFSIISTTIVNSMVGVRNGAHSSTFDPVMGKAAAGRLPPEPPSPPATGVPLAPAPYSDVIIDDSEEPWHFQEAAYCLPGLEQACLQAVASRYQVCRSTAE